MTVCEVCEEDGEEKRDTANALVAAVWRDWRRLLSAGALFSACIAADTLSALPLHRGEAETPSSLRAASFAAVFALASPVVRPNNPAAALQRPVLLVVMATLAWLGLHHGTAELSSADCVFTTLMCAAGAWLFSSGGVDVVTKDSADGVQVQASAKASFTDLLLALASYCGARMFRSAAEQAHEAAWVSFGTGDDGGGGDLYAHSSALCALAIAAAGGSLFASAATPLCTEAASDGGDALVASLAAAAVGGAVQLVAALVSTLGLANSMDALPALFGVGACTDDSCAAAAAARRAVIFNVQAPAAWLAAAGSIVLGGEHLLARYTSLASVTIFLAWTAMNIAIVSLGGTSLYATSSALLLCATQLALLVPEAWPSAAAATAVAVAIHEFDVISNHGLQETVTYLTHVTLLLIALQMFAASFSALCLQTSQQIRTALFEAAAGTGLLLFLLSTGLMMAFNGKDALFNEHDAPANVTLLNFVVEHFLVPQAVLTCWYTHRMFCNANSTSSRRFWVLGPTFVVAVYAAVLVFAWESFPLASSISAEKVYAGVAAIVVSPYVFAILAV